MKVHLSKNTQLLAGAASVVLWSGLLYGFSGSTGDSVLERRVNDLERRVVRLEAYARSTPARRVNPSKNQCISNLKQIESAKEQWAMVNRKTATSTPRVADLVGTPTSGFLKRFPSCPSGGTYTIGNMSNRPTCSKGGSEGHELY